MCRIRVQDPESRIRNIEVVECQAEHFFGSVTEQGLRCGVGFYEAPGIEVYQAYGLGGLLDHRAVALFVLLLLFMVVFQRPQHVVDRVCKPGNLVGAGR